MSKRVLLCPPTYFDVTYSINAWMDPSKGANRSVAQQQWDNLHATYEQLGYQIELIEPQPDLPDMVFTANGGLVIGGKVMLPRFQNIERQPETELFKNWFEAAGFETKMPENVFEGEGDCLYSGKNLFAGFGFRSSRESHKELAEYFDVPVVGLKLVDPRFYHLDTALCPLTPTAAMYYPGAFDATSRQILKIHYPTLIEASPEDALAFGLNSVSDGKNVVINRQASGLIAALKQHGFNPVLTDTSEFKKSGGGNKCLTLELRSKE